MSKYESGRGWIIPYHKMDAQQKQKCQDLLEMLGARWCNGDPVEPTLHTLKGRRMVRLYGDGNLWMSSASETFYRTENDFGAQFISYDYFVFLAEDHLYEQQA